MKHTDKEKAVLDYLEVIQGLQDAVNLDAINAGDVSAELKALNGSAIGIAVKKTLPEAIRTVVSKQIRGSYPPGPIIAEPVVAKPKEVEKSKKVEKVKASVVKPPPVAIKVTEEDLQAAARAKLLARKVT